MKIFIIWFLCFFLTLNLTAEWKPVRKLSSNDISVSLNENMGQCIGTSGDSIHVVFRDVKGNGSAVYYKHSFDGGNSWSSDTCLTGNASKIDFPSIAVSGQHIHIDYRDTLAGQNVSCYINSSDAGITWGQKKIIGYYYWWPSIAAFGNNVYMSLNSNETGNSEVWCRRSTNNGTDWDSVVRISNALKRSEDPAIAASDGYVYLAWNDTRNNDTMQIYYRRSTDNGITWGTETNLSNTHKWKNVYAPMLSARGSHVDAVWMMGLNNIQHKHSSDYGATWTEDDTLMIGRSSLYPSIIRDGNNVHLISSGSVSGLLYQNSFDGGATWQKDTGLVSPANKPGSAFVAVTRSAVHLIWTDQRSGHNALYYMRSKQNNKSIDIIAVPNQFCIGTAFSISFVTTGNFSSDNMFTAQLSDEKGNFSNPVSIGILKSQNSGIINAVLPENVAAGTAYRIRIISSNPIFTGSDNGANLILNPLPIVSITGQKTAKENEKCSYQANITDGTYLWSITNGTIEGTVSNETVNVTWGKSGKGVLKLIESTKYGCIDSLISDVNIAMNQIDELPKRTGIELIIKPNPLNENAIFEITSNNDIFVCIQIVNSFGITVNSINNILIKAGRKMIEWNGIDFGGNLLPTGIYFIELSDGNFKIAEKAVIIR